jgi:hypothetical protein
MMDVPVDIIVDIMCCSIVIVERIQDSHVILKQEAELRLKVFNVL